MGENHIMKIREELINFHLVMIHLNERDGLCELQNICTNNENSIGLEKCLQAKF